MIRHQFIKLTTDKVMFDVGESLSRVLLALGLPKVPAISRFSVGRAFNCCKNKSIHQHSLKQRYKLRRIEFDTEVMTHTAFSGYPWLSLAGSNFGNRRQSYSSVATSTRTIVNICLLFFLEPHSRVNGNREHQTP